MPTATRPSWWGGVLPTLVLPVVVALFTVAGTRWAMFVQPAARPFDALAAVLLLIGPIALVPRRANPPLALLVVAMALAGYLIVGYPVGPIPVAGPASV